MTATVKPNLADYCPGHESVNGAIGNVEYCNGTCTEGREAYADATADEQLAVEPRVLIRLISARVARRLLREVVADYGRHHSIGRQPCAYIDHSGQVPLCLVGCVLYLAGLSEDELYELDRLTPAAISQIRLPARVRMTGAARRVLQVAQSAQDDTAERKGLPWGAALDAALAVRPYQRTAVAA